MKGRHLGKGWRSFGRSGLSRGRPPEPRPDGATTREPTVGVRTYPRVLSVERRRAIRCPVVPTLTRIVDGVSDHRVRRFCRGFCEATTTDGPSRTDDWPDGVSERYCPTQSARDGGHKGMTLEGPATHAVSAVTRGIVVSSAAFGFGRCGLSVRRGCRSRRTGGPCVALAGRAADLAALPQRR